MAILTKEELMQKLRDRFADDTSDEVIQFTEDVSDTLTDMQKRTQDSTDWEKKYKENDEMWRKKYKERFFSPSPKEDEENFDETDGDNPPKTYRYEELFKEEK